MTKFLSSLLTSSAPENKKHTHTHCKLINFLQCQKMLAFKAGLSRLLAELERKTHRRELNLNVLLMDPIRTNVFGHRDVL